MYAKDNITIKDRREQLRVKSKSLAEEARIIRREERRTHGRMRDELWQHRTGIVRCAARSTGIAYGFIRGLTLEQMEPTRKSDPDWEAVRKMLKRYGPPGMPEPDVMRKS